MTETELVFAKIKFDGNEVTVSGKVAKTCPHHVTEVRIALPEDLAGSLLSVRGMHNAQSALRNNYVQHAHDTKVVHVETLLPPINQRDHNG